MGRVFQRKEREGWYIEYVDENGRPIRKRASTDKGVAIRILHKLESDVELAKAGLKTIVTNNVMVSHILEPYLLFIANHRRKSSVVRIRVALARILNWISENKDTCVLQSLAHYRIRVDEITPIKISAYQGSRIKNCSTRTTNLEVTALKTLLNWAVTNGLIYSNPMAKVPSLKKKPVKLRRALTEDEIKSLLANCPDYLAPVVSTFLWTGMRKNELVELRWSDVDFRHRKINIRAEIAKTHTARTIPINTSLMELLVKLKEKSTETHVFLNKEGRPWRHNLYVRFKNAVKKAGIDRQEEIDLHALRYTFATYLIRRTGNPKLAQELLGHKDISITLEIYAQVFNEDKDKAVEALNDLTAVKPAAVASK